MKTISKKGSKEKEMSKRLTVFMVAVLFSALSARGSQLRLDVALQATGAAMVRLRVVKTEDGGSDTLAPRVTGPFTHRLAQIRERAEGFVEVMKLSGAEAEELATVLFAVLNELEREAHDKRRRF